MVLEGGVAGGTQTTEISSQQQNLKAKDGKILEMQKSADQRKESKEIVIPIQIQGQSSIQQKPRTPKPRMLPFEFPSMPSFGMSIPSATTGDSSCARTCPTRTSTL